MVLPPLARRISMQTQNVHRIFIALAALGFSFPTAQPDLPPTVAPAVPGPTASGKVILISWDGAADWVVDRLLSEGRLPNLRRLAERGSAAEYMLASFPSVTASGQASIFTGAWPDAHGVTGNSVPIIPKAEHSFVETQSGFSSAALRAEPIFETAAKRGKNVVVLSATQSYPADRWLRELNTVPKPNTQLRALNFRSFSGFETEIAKPAMIDFNAKIVPVEAWTDLPRGNGPYREITFNVADTTFYVLAYNDPDDPANGYDTLLIRPNSRELRVAKVQSIMKPSQGADTNDKFWSRPFKLPKGKLYGFVSFRLFALDPELEHVKLYQGRVSMVRGTATPDETAKYNEALRGFHDDPFGSYEDGMFGKTIWQGGDGQAEARALEIVRRDVENLKRGTAFALSKWNPDLLTLYEPMTDGAGHEWMGVLDPNSPSYDKALADRLWPFYARIFELEDEWLGSVMEAAPEYSIIVVSDHGMEGTNRFFYPNSVLEKGGLLKRTFGNAVEPAQTKIAAPPSGGFFLVVNGLEWKQGLVPDSQREAVIEEARNQLASARDPASGELIVRHIYRPTDLPDLGLGGPNGGDLYLDVAPGYYPLNQISDKIAARSNSPVGDGNHGFVPTRRSMQAIFYMGGRGMNGGAQLGPVRQIDIAPTIAKILGIDAPSGYRGRALP